MAEKTSVWRSPLATGQIEYYCHSTCTDRTCLHHLLRLARHRPCPVRNRCRPRHRPGHRHRSRPRRRHRLRPQPQHRPYLRPQPRRHPWLIHHCACVDLDHRPRLTRHRPCPVPNRLRHRPRHRHRSRPRHRHRPRPQPQHRSYLRPQPRRHPWITRHCACVDPVATARSADVHRRQPQNRLFHHRPLRCTSHRPFLSTTATPYVVLSRQLLSGWELARA